VHPELQPDTSVGSTNLMAGPRCSNKS